MDYLDPSNKDIIKIFDDEEKLYEEMLNAEQDYNASPSEANEKSVTDKQEKWRKCFDSNRNTLIAKPIHK